jgi:hypothetical protein
MKINKSKINEVVINLINLLCKLKQITILSFNDKISYHQPQSIFLNGDTWYYPLDSIYSITIHGISNLF